MKNVGHMVGEHIWFSHLGPITGYTGTFLACEMILCFVNIFINILPFKKEQ